MFLGIDLKSNGLLEGVLFLMTGRISFFKQVVF